MTRANDEVQRLTDDLQKVAAIRNNERRESLEQMEILSAKGSLLDEVLSELFSFRSMFVNYKHVSSIHTLSKDHVLRNPCICRFKRNMRI